MAVAMTRLFLQPAPSGGKFQKTETTILIIEDDTELLNLIKSILEDEGFKVLKALNGIEALNIIENILPTIILLDLRMPMMGGAEFINKLVATGKRDYVTIILFTAEHRAKDFAENLGADDCLIKPFNLMDLFKVIQKYI